MNKYQIGHATKWLRIWRDVFFWFYKKYAIKAKTLTKEDPATKRGASLWEEEAGFEEEEIEEADPEETAEEAKVVETEAPDSAEETTDFAPDSATVTTDFTSETPFLIPEEATSAARTISLLTLETPPERIDLT